MQNYIQNDSTSANGNRPADVPGRLNAMTDTASVDDGDSEPLLWISEAELDTRPVPLIDNKRQAQHIDLIRHRIDWSATSIGSQWSPLLSSYVSMVLASPFPSLLAWGKDRIMIYNRPYADVIGQKHPRIMGQAYAVAWSEVWGMIKAPIEAAFRGEGTHVVDQQLFLQKSDRLEECYFTWSMIPIRGETGEIVGIYVPNFDGSRSVIRERQMSIIQNLGQNLSGVTEFLEFYARAKEGLSENKVDLPLVAIYSTDASELAGSDAVSRTVSSEIESEHSFCRITGENPPVLTFTKEILMGCRGDHPAFPETITSNANEPPPGQGPCITNYIYDIHKGANILHLPEDVVRQVIGDIKCVTWGEEITHVVLFPIRIRDRDQLHAVVVVGMNTRRPYNQDSELFIQLLQRSLTAGVAGVMLFTEEIRRTKSLAALNLRKNEELRVLLDARTKELLETEGKFTRMAEISRSGLIIVDPQTEHITFANQAWFYITGHPRDKNPDRYIESIHPEDVNKVAESWKLAMKGAAKLEFRCKQPTKKGLVRWCESLSTLEKDGNGRIVAVIISLSDISDRKRNEELLRKEALEAIERKRQQENFIDMTQHEMRNPLSAIMHSLDLITSSLASVQKEIQAYKADVNYPRVHRPLDSNKCLADIEEAMETVKIVELCSSHMKRLTDDTLTLSKLESDLVVLYPSVFAPQIFCRTVLKMFEAEVQKKDITTVFDIRPSFSENGGDFLEADSARLSQILINLITNAIKFTSGRPIRKIGLSIECLTERPLLPKFNFEILQSDITTIESLRSIGQTNVSEPSQAAPMDRASLEDGLRFLLVRVTDTGVGMSKAELGLLFHRFSQIRPRTHTTYDGSGLGLYISKMLTSRLGGEITVESVEGQGSTFTFYIETRTVPETAGFAIVDTESRTASLLAEIKIPPSAIASANYDSTPLPSPISPSLMTHLAKIHTVDKPLYRLLLVEDNIINQKLMCKQLLKANCAIATADNGLQAIEYLLTTKYADPFSSVELDLVLMDMEMPVMGGLEACKRIREMEQDGRLSRHVPIIAVTANARAEQMEIVVDVGMDSVVSKPFKWPVLMTEIARVLRSLNEL